MSSNVTDGSPSRSYFAFTAFTPHRCSIEYSNIDACPIERTNRSRFGQIGSSGSNRRNRCHRPYTTGAIAIAVPGCPDCAVWTASMESVRIVVIAS